MSHPPTQIRFLIGGEGVTCRGSKLTNSQEKQQHKLSTRTTFDLNVSVGFASGNIEGLGKQNCLFVHITPEEFENGDMHHTFSVHMLRRRNLKTEQLPVILDLCLRTARSGKSRDYRDVIVFENLRFSQNE